MRPAALSGVLQQPALTFGVSLTAPRRHPEAAEASLRVAA